MTAATPVRFAVWTAALGCALALLAAAASAEVAVPPLRSRVTDLAGVLPPERARALEERLAAFERETSHQIAVLSVPTLEGEPIESFSLRVVEAWQLGQEGLDNGMLLVVASQDREARVEVGYGLEGVVPDVVAKRVIEDVMIPRFRAGDLPGGIEAAVTALMSAARGEEIPQARRARKPSSGRGDPLALVVAGSIFASFLSLPLRRRSRVLAALAGGGIGAGFVWLVLASTAWAALAFLIGALFGGLGPLHGGRGGLIGVPRGGGFGGGGFGGGGGGFGGGGGGFGGGGASGSW
jgi:uncharacterized protein